MKALHAVKALRNCSKLSTRFQERRKKHAIVPCGKLLGFQHGAIAFVVGTRNSFKTGAFLFSKYKEGRHYWVD